MGFLGFFPAFGYLLAIIYGLHLLGLFPYCIDLPIYGGVIENFGKANEVIKGMPIPINGVEWYPTWGTVLLLVSIGVLFWELLKSVKPTDMVAMDHALSTLVFIGYFGLFLTQQWAGNSLFLTVGLMALLDVIAGFTISITAARRDLMVGG